MATIQDQIAKAKAAGYSDADIAQHLSATPDFGAKIKTATDAGYKPDEIVAHLSGNATSGSTAPPQPEPSTLSKIGQGVGNLAAGAVRGAGSIGATILAPYDIAKDALAGKGLTLESNNQRRADMDAGLQSLGAQPDSMLYKGGKLAGEIAGTAGAGGLMARGLAAVPKVAAVAPNLLQAIKSSGMTAGTTTGLSNVLTRAAGGAIAGGAQAGLIDPRDAGTGAVIGGALPPALMALGAAGKAIGRTISGPAVASELRQTVTSARDAGYVIPPSQVKPSLVNRALEGFSGKITTAQNASARNQPITNELAKKAIGAADLSPSGIAQVRQQANSAYDALGQSGAFQADAGFAQALDKAGASTAELRKNFPELVNGQVDDLVNGLKSRSSFDAQPTIEAIKQFRSNASGNRISTDPAKKALGKAQSSIANALEDLIDRNLQASGNTGLLDSYRAARQTLAKTYDVEKALNSASGNVDANKLAQIFKKGRPMTGDLRTIAEFAAQFPKAAQTVEKMGSLPQISPLDFGAMGAISAATANPMMMTGILARPAARAAVLSGPVQNRLAAQPGRNALMSLLSNPAVEQSIYRSAPAINGH